MTLELSRLWQGGFSQIRSGGHNLRPPSSPVRWGRLPLAHDPTSTYAYLGTSDSITTIANSAGTTYSTIDAIGDRLASGVGTTIGWIVPDLHGNVVAAIGPDATFVNALRFDPYGQTVATWTATTGSVKMPWRYQGRILESAGTGSSTDLYDVEPPRRMYSPTGRLAAS